MDKRGSFMQITVHVSRWVQQCQGGHTTLIAPVQHSSPPVMLSLRETNQKVPQSSTKRFCRCQFSQQPQHGNLRLSQSLLTVIDRIVHPPDSEGLQLFVWVNQRTRPHLSCLPTQTIPKQTLVALSVNNAYLLNLRFSPITNLPLKNHISYSPFSSFYSCFSLGLFVTTHHYCLLTPPPNID